MTAGGQTYHAGAAVLRARDAEPDRAGGHLPAARGAARPLHVQRRRSDYPSQAEEERIVATTTGAYEAAARDACSTATEILALQQLVRRVPVAEHVVRYAVRLARATRAGDGRRAGVRAGNWVTLGRRPARLAVPGARRQGARGAARPLRARHRGRAGGRARGAAPPHRHQLHRRGRGREARPHRRPTSWRTCRPRSARPPMAGSRHGHAASGSTRGSCRELGRLDLMARLVVEGFITGLHKSPYHGFSVEFAEHRQYMPGDPLRHLDWKVCAKTDRYYIKQYEEETNLRAPPAARPLGVDGLRSTPGGADQARVRALPRRGAGLPDARSSRTRSGCSRSPRRSTATSRRARVGSHLDVVLRRARAHAARRPAPRCGRVAARPGRAHPRRGLVVLFSRPDGRARRGPAGPAALPPPPARGGRLPHPRPGGAHVRLQRARPRSSTSRPARRSRSSRGRSRATTGSA